MKKVASIADVHRMALSSGARAEVDGQVFNAAKLRLVLPKPAAPPQPQPQPQPQPAQAVPTAPAQPERKPVASVAERVPASVLSEVSVLQEIVSHQTEAIAALAAQVEAATRQLAQRATPKAVDVTYDEDGRITRINLIQGTPT